VVAPDAELDVRPVGVVSGGGSLLPRFTTNRTWAPALMSAEVAAVVTSITVLGTMPSVNLPFLPAMTRTLGPLKRMAPTSGPLRAKRPRRVVGVFVGFTTWDLALFDFRCSPTLIPMPSPASSEITIASASEPSRKRGERSSTVLATVRRNERFGVAAMYHSSGGSDVGYPSAGREQSCRSAAALVIGAARRVACSGLAAFPTRT
jgi:hypothetical protein